MGFSYSVAMVLTTFSHRALRDFDTFRTSRLKYYTVLSDLCAYLSYYYAPYDGLCRASSFKLIYYDALQ